MDALSPNRSFGRKQAYTCSRVQTPVNTKYVHKHFRSRVHMHEPAHTKLGQDISLIGKQWDAGQ